MLIATYVDVEMVNFDSYRYISEHWYDKGIFLEKCHKKPDIKMKERKRNGTSESNQTLTLPCCI